MILLSWFADYLFHLKQSKITATLKIAPRAGLSPPSLGLFAKNVPLFYVSSVFATETYSLFLPLGSFTSNDRFLTWNLYLKFRISRTLSGSAIVKFQFYTTLRREKGPPVQIARALFISLLFQEQTISILTKAPYYVTSNWNFEFVVSNCRIFFPCQKIGVWNEWRRGNSIKFLF